MVCAPFFLLVIHALRAFVGPLSTDLSTALVLINSVLKIITADLRIRSDLTNMKIAGAI